MRVHVGFILTIAWCEAGEIFLDQNLQVSTTVQILLCGYRNLLAGRPLLNFVFRNTYRQRIVGKVCFRPDSRGRTFENIVKRTATSKSDPAPDQSIDARGLDLSLREAKSNRIVENTELQYGNFVILASPI